MKIPLLLSTALTGMLLGPSVSATLFVVPAHLATTEGNSNFSSPFLTYPETKLGMRYQQIMNADQLPAGPILINGFSLRPNQIGSDYTYNWSQNVDFRLSTTPVLAEDISRVFAENLGSTETTVLAGLVSFSSSGVGSSSVQPFNIYVPFATPFLYDPAQGNLLLDARFTGNGTQDGAAGGPSLDFYSESVPTGVGYAYTGPFTGTPGTSPEADWWSSSGSGGLIIQLDYTPVPEPAEWAGLAALGCLGWAAGVGRKRTAARRAATHHL